MAHLVALHGCRILANMACDGETLGPRRVGRFSATYAAE